MYKSQRLFQAALRSPLLWGVLTSFGFYGLIRAGILSGEFIQRYFASHPVEYVATTMFFVGSAALVRKMVAIFGQYSGLSQSLLGPVTPSGQTGEDPETLLKRLGRFSDGRENDYLVRRLRETLEHVQRRGSADSLDEQLKYLADVDADRLHSSYALVRVIIWAIPILGFLGTVIGITLAIANLAPEALEDSLPMVTAGLGVAFDTTALALGLSIVLMFAQFFTDRAETALLEQVDVRATADLAGRFEQISAGPDGQLVAVRRMVETMLEATGQLVERQAALWQKSIEAASSRWTAMAETSGKQLQTALSGALAESLKVHAGQLVADGQAASDQNRRHWALVQQTQTRQTRAVESLQEAAARQAEMLSKVIEATGKVAQLEETLNRNLGALAGAKNFEQTVMSLAAAIHLLNGRLADVPAATTPPVTLQPNPSATQAA
ncbi:MAG: MotA/TolQ/ExbB proton channel family protein [Thermoguttaceae bacterium]